MLVTISPSVWDVPQTVLTLNFAKMTGLVKNLSGHLELKSKPIANTEPKQKSEFDEAWDSMYYIEFLPAGKPRPKIVFDFPSTPEDHTLLEKLKDHTVTGYGV